MLPAEVRATSEEAALALQEMGVTLHPDGVVKGLYSTEMSSGPSWKWIPQWEDLSSDERVAKIMAEREAALQYFRRYSQAALRALVDTSLTRAKKAAYLLAALQGPEGKGALLSCAFLIEVGPGDFRLRPLALERPA